MFGGGSTCLWGWALLCACVVAADDLQSLLDNVTRRVNSWQSSPRRHHRYARPSIAELPTEPATDPPLKVTTPANSHHNQQQVEELWKELMAGYQSDQPRTAFQLKQQMATRQGVDRLRKLGPERAFDPGPPENEDDTLAAAMAHMKSIYLSPNLTCAEPAGRLVRVSDIYPSASTSYFPAMVVLQKCSDDTGCCMHEVQTCAAIQTRTLTRAFMVYNFGKASAKTLKFTEDVSCRCVKRTSVHRTSCTSHAVLNDASSEESLTRMHRPHHSRGRPSNHKHKTCRCPSEFVSRPYLHGRCKCDCYDGNKKCSRVKRGKTYLPEHQNRCIIRGSCDPPDCSFGIYMKRWGRCPRRLERNRSFLDFAV